jgi:hypothetical protein
MDPRPWTSRITQRTLRAVTVTALSLGLAATVLAPTAASAAPANSLITDAKSDLTAGILDFESFEPGKRRDLSIVVVNNGDARSYPVDLKIETGGDFYWPYAKSVAGHGITCDQGRIDPATNRAVINCKIPQIMRNSHRALTLNLSKGSSGENWIRTTIDPQNADPESDETNNVSVRRY